MYLVGTFGSKERVRLFVAGQHGRVTRAQLRMLGASDRMIASWLDQGYLQRVLPRVYAVGYTATGREADLWAAILYAGPRAMLSHRTAAHWRGLIDYPTRVIEVSTPRKVKSLASIRVYAERHTARERHSRLPVTSIEQTVLDLAAIGNLKLVRRALANLDYMRQLDVEALQVICRRGRPGSKRLKQALEHHQPQLAHTNGALEDVFLGFCEQHAIPIPDFNVKLHGLSVDAHWPAAKLVVELDGYRNHSSAAQLHRDRRNDLALRRHGLTVRRYDWALLDDDDHGRAIRDEILAELNFLA